MKKIIKINDITLNNPLFLDEYKKKYLKANVYKSLQGNSIIYYRNRNIQENEFTLDSLENGWQKKECVDKIFALLNSPFVVNLTTSDEEIIKARFKIEDDDVFEATALYEGSEWYRVRIKMEYA